GRVAVAGYHQGVFTPPWGGAAWDSGGPGEQDGFLVVLGADGSHSWHWRHDGPLRDWVEGVDFDGRGGLIATGLYSGTLATSVFTRAAEDRDGFALLFAATDGLA